MATTEQERERFARLDMDTIAAAIEGYTGEYNVRDEIEDATNESLWRGFAELGDNEREAFWCVVGAVKLLNIVEG